MRADDGQHGLAIPIRVTPVAFEHAAEPVEILDRKRTIEAQLPGDAIEVFLRHLRRERELRERTARRQMKDRKAERRDDHQQYDRLYQAIGDVTGHLRQSSWSDASGPVPFADVPTIGRGVDVG